MASASFIVAHNAGATLAVTYDTGTLAVTHLALDASQALRAVNWSATRANVVVHSGTVQPGTVDDWAVPANAYVLAQGPGLPGGVFQAGDSLQTWT